jgi:hypothetical protein
LSSRSRSSVDRRPRSWRVAITPFWKKSATEQG